MDWAAILAAAQRAAAAYITDETQAQIAFEALGDTYVSQYINADHQAYVTCDSAMAWHLSISGTRFGRSLPDLFDDADIVPHDLGGGCEVSAGVYGGMGELWAWALNLSPAGAAWTVSGHSLGAERSLLTGLFLGIDQITAIYAFEAPKCGNLALWTKLAPSLAKATCICNGHDIWFGYPEVSEWIHPPIPHIHLLESGYEMVGPLTWPDAYSLDDHAIALDVQRLVTLAAV